MYKQIACIYIHFRPELFSTMEYRLYVLRLYNPSSTCHVTLEVVVYRSPGEIIGAGGSCLHTMCGRNCWVTSVINQDKRPIFE